MLELDIKLVANILKCPDTFFFFKVFLKNLLTNKILMGYWKSKQLRKTQRAKDFCRHGE